MTPPDYPDFYPAPCPTCGVPHDPMGGMLGPISDAPLCGDCAVRRDAILEYEDHRPVQPPDDYFGNCPTCGGSRRHATPEYEQHQEAVEDGHTGYFVCLEHRRLCYLQHHGPKYQEANA